MSEQKNFYKPDKVKIIIWRDFIIIKVEKESKT